MATQFADATEPKRKGKPTIRERVAARVCPNCGKPSPERKSARGPAPLYCDNGGACKRAMNNRNLADGLALVPYLKAWRVDRGTGEIAQGSFQRICQIVDALNEEDRLGQRPRADYYAAKLLASNAAPVDELRYGRRKIAEARRDRAATAPEVEAAPEQAPEPEQKLDLAEVLRQIANGHNDPRRLAEEVLASLSN